MAVFSASGAAGLPISVPSPASNIGEPEPPISVSSTSTPEFAPTDPLTSTTSESLLTSETDDALQSDGFTPANDNLPPLETAVACPTSRYQDLS